MKELRKGENKTLNSKLEWQKEYDSNKMKVTGIKHSVEERERWEKAAEKNNMKLSPFVRLCVKYCIENNIDLKNE
ncbi:MAG: hypothetical protein IJX15_07620 [Ruminiclostridium sp.]|nr:hypothetical protein [Ruminiclostridium sp.]